MTKQADIKLLPGPLEDILKHLPGTLGAEEVYSHLENMPAYYWDELTKADLIFHLTTINEFFIRLIQEPVRGAALVVKTRHFPKKGYSEVAVCTWDRKGLVSKIAGSLTCAKLDIKKAFVYTRMDHVVLDVFHVASPEGKSLTGKKIMGKVEAYLEQSLEPVGPLDLSGLLENTILNYHRARWQRKGRKKSADVSVEWVNHNFKDYTCLRITAPDTQGLLYTILDELNVHQINVHLAAIQTRGKKALDEFCVTDCFGRKLTDACLRARLAGDIEKRIRSLFE